MDFYSFIKWLDGRLIYCDTLEKQREVLRYFHDNGIHRDAYLERDVFAHNYEQWVLIGNTNWSSYTAHTIVNENMYFEVHGYGETYLAGHPYITFEEFEVITIGHEFEGAADVLTLIS